MKIDLLALIVIVLISSVSTTLLLVYHVYGGKVKLAHDAQTASHLIESTKRSVQIIHEDLRMIGQRTVQVIDDLRGVSEDFRRNSLIGGDSLESSIRFLQTSLEARLEDKLNSLRVHAGDNPIYILKPGLVTSWHVSIVKEDIERRELRIALETWLLAMKPQGAPKDPDKLREWVYGLVDDRSVTVFNHILVEHVSKAKWEAIVALAVKDQPQVKDIT